MKAYLLHERVWVRFLALYGTGLVLLPRFIQSWTLWVCRVLRVKIPIGGI